ncbi:hypothetical protein QFC21_002422 [Naganishia friedmannii]|uniref:Uncharacterized protein n=1 Tax=Naganishia friedmannii TaxID=89922 RepID=A0ACC2VWX0_9TREE|nr:hypothetical protein QFC21_002422 [Naganishia friedmannii]
MRIKKKGGSSAPLWLLLLANYLLSPVIATTYGYRQENYTDITYHDYDNAEVSTSTSVPVSVFTQHTAFTTATGPTLIGSSYPATSYLAYSTTYPTKTTHSAIRSSSPSLPASQQVVRRVTDVEYDIGDHPRAYDNPERLLTELPSLEVIHHVADVPQDINGPSGMRDDIKQHPVDTQLSEIVREELDVPLDLIDPPPIDDDLEQPSIDTRDRRSAHVMNDPAHAFIDIPSHSTTHDNDSSNTNAITTTTDHQVRADSATESSDSERKNGFVSGKMDNAEKRRRIVLSSTCYPVFNKVITVGRLALDFGVNWLPKDWNPHKDPPKIDHIVEEWVEKLAVQDGQNAEGDAINHVLRGKLQQVDVTLTFLKHKVEVLEMAETRHEETNERQNERDTAADARELETDKKERAAEALMKEANENYRLVKKRFLHKTMRDLSKDHRFDTTDSRSTAVSIPQSPPFWRILPPQPYCPVPRSSLAIRILQAVRALWRYLQQTVAWLKSVDWRRVGRDVRRRILIAGQKLSIMLYHLCWFFVLYARHTKIETTDGALPGPPWCPGSYPHDLDLYFPDDLGDDGHRPQRSRSNSSSHEGQFRPPRTRFIENELRRRGRYGLADRSPPPEYLESIASRPITPTQLITERAARPGAARFLSVLDERLGRLVEHASSFRRSRSLSPRMIPSRNEDVVRPLRQSATPSRPVLVEPAAEPELLQPLQPLDDAVATPNLVNDAAAGLLDLGLVGPSVFHTPSPPGHFQAGDAVSSDAPAEVVPETVTEDQETVLPLQHDVSVPTFSGGPEPINVDAPASDIATENVEMILAPEPNASVGTTVTNSVSDDAQVPRDEVPDEAQVPRDEEQEVLAPVQQAPSPRTVDVPPSSTTDDDERTMVEPETPSMQPDAPVLRVTSSPFVSIKVMQRKDEEEEPPSIEQAAVLPVPVLVDEVAVAPPAPAFPVGPSSPVMLATPMDVEDVREAEFQPEPCCPVRAVSPVTIPILMETEPTFMRSVIQPAPVAELQTPMDVEGMNVAEFQPTSPHAMAVDEFNVAGVQPIPCPPIRLLPAPTWLEDETMEMENVDEDIEDVGMEVKEVLSEIEDVEMESDDSSLRLEEPDMGIDEIMEGTSARDASVVLLTEMITVPVVPAAQLSAGNFSVFKLPALTSPRPSTWTTNSAFNTPATPTQQPQRATTTRKEVSGSANVFSADFKLPAVSTHRTSMPAAEMSTSVRVISKKDCKPLLPNMVKRPPPTSIIHPSRAAVDPNFTNDSPRYATVHLLDVKKKTPYEIEEARKQEILEDINKHRTERATPAVKNDISTEPSSDSSTQVDRVGRTGSVQRRWKPTKPKPKPIDPTISLTVMSTQGATTSTDTANADEKSQSNDAPVPAPAPALPPLSAYPPWEVDRVSAREVLRIFGEQPEFAVQPRVVPHALPAPSITQGPTHQRVFQNAGQLMMDPLLVSADAILTINKGIPASGAMQQAQTQGERRSQALPARRRISASTTQPLPIDNQQECSAPPAPTPNAFEIPELNGNRSASTPVLRTVDDAFNPTNEYDELPEWS